MLTRIKNFFQFRYSRTLLLTVILLLAIIFSVARLIWAATANPGHDWGAMGDGTFVTAGLTAPRVFTFPDASTTVLTTSSVVTVPQGGTGTSSLTGILVGNGTAPFTAVHCPDSMFTGGSLVGDTDTQTIIDKTISASNNTITDTGIALGDLLKSDGSKFVRFARGSAGQLLRTNSAGTDLEWTSAGIGPAGSDKWLQYNDNGGLGASSSLAWDQSSKSLNLSGYVEMSATPLPAVAPAGTMRLFVRSVSGREMLAVRTDEANDYYVLQPSLFQNSISMIGTNNSTTFSTSGTNVTTVAGGTTSHTVSEATGFMANLLTSTAINNISSTGDTVVIYYRGSMVGRNGYFFFARVGAGPSLANIRYYVGLTDQLASTSVAIDNPAGNRSGFSFSTALSETNWMFSNKDGSTESRNSTGVAVTINHVYDLYFYTPPQGSAVNWRIDDLTANTTTEGSLSNNLPTSNVAMRSAIGVANLTAGTAKRILFQKIYVEVPR